MARVIKDSAVERKLRAVEDELHALKKGMKNLSKEMGKRRPPEEDPFESIPAPTPQPVATVVESRPIPREESEPIPERVIERPIERQMERPAMPTPSPVSGQDTDEAALRSRTARPSPAPERIREGRFADYYVANSYRSNRPLRHEMKVQRARALFMLACTILFLAWFLYMWGPTISSMLSGEGAATTP